MKQQKQAGIVCYQALVALKRKQVCRQIKNKQKAKDQ